MKASPWTFRFNTRTLIIMMVGLILNGLFFGFSYWMKLPLTLNTCGSLYAALAAGPIAGIIVEIITAIPLMFWVYAPIDLLFVITALLAVILTGTCFKGGQVNSPFSLLGLVLMVFLSNVIINTGISMLFFAGKPYDFYSTMLFGILSAAGFSRIAASSMTNIVIQFFDTFTAFLIAGGALFLTPKAKKNFYSA